VEEIAEILNVSSIMKRVIPLHFKKNIIMDKKEKTQENTITPPSQENNSNSSNSKTTQTSESQLDSSIATNDYTKELKKFFIKSLQDIYYAEHAIEEKLGEIKAKANAEALEEALEDHELMTKKQILRLEKIFKLLNESPKKNKCEAIVGILKEGDEMIRESKEKSTLRDIAIIFACQKVEHYEIASYNGLLQLAVTLNLEKVTQLLETTYEEEEETDLLLNDILEQDLSLESYNDLDL